MHCVQVTSMFYEFDLLLRILADPAVVAMVTNSTTGAPLLSS